MKNLNFLQTLTIEQFKAKHNVSRIDVKRNPNSGKLFMTFGSQTGAVASKGIPAANKAVISEVSTPEGECFWMLHEEGNGGAPTLAQF